MQCKADSQSLDHQESPNAFYSSSFLSSDLSYFPFFYHSVTYALNSCIFYLRFFDFFKCFLIRHNSFHHDFPLPVNVSCAVLCLVAQSSLTLCDPMNYSPPGTPLSVGILQATVLEWVAMPSSRGSYQPRGWTQVSHIAGGFFTIWSAREALNVVCVHEKHGMRESPGKFLLSASHEHHKRPSTENTVYTLYNWISLPRKDMEGYYQEEQLTATGGKLDWTSTH